MPGLVSPKKGSRIGILGGVAPTLDWSDVADPSGVTYTLEMDTSPDFPNPFLSKADVTFSGYSLTEANALSRGRYYWRVKAIDGAYNESAWSEPWGLSVGLMSLGTLVALIAVGLLAIGGVAYFFLLYRPRKRLAPVLEPGVVTVLPEYRRALKEAEEGTQPGTLERLLRLAPPKTTGPAEDIPVEELVRARIIDDFARSLPLVQPGYNADWFVELAKATTGRSDTDAIAREWLSGVLTFRYEPAWGNHPLYLELRSALTGHPVLQDLDGFIQAANGCIQECGRLLQDIYRDSVAEIPEEAIERQGWNFVFGVYADALGWFRGRFLSEPSEREYSIKIEAGVPWLYGQEASAFAGPLVRAGDENEALRFREVHLRLRRNYRRNEGARALTELIATLEVQRGRILRTFSQVGPTRDSR